MGFAYTPAMLHRSDSSHGSSFSAEARLTFYESHRSMALFMILIVFSAPVAGLLGVAIGVLVSAVAYVLVPFLWQWIGD